MSGPVQDSEPEAKVLLIKRLYRAVVESVHKLDVIIGGKASYREVFKPENISLRNKYVLLCVYHVHSRSALECAYRTHLIAGVGFYQHLLLYIQSHYQLELQDSIDWTHVTDPLIARYQNELAGVEAEQLAERYYHQALSVTPHGGMPFNQLGTLAGSKFYNVEATYYYLRCIQSDAPFEGAYGNLKRLFDKAAKMYQQVKKQEMKKLSPSRQRLKDIKHLLVSFMYLQSLLQPKNSIQTPRDRGFTRPEGGAYLRGNLRFSAFSSSLSPSVSSPPFPRVASRCSPSARSLMETELTELCQSVLEDFNLVLFYLPPTPTPGGALHPASEEEEEQPAPQHADSSSPVLPDTLVFKMVVTCLMVVHSLKKGAKLSRAQGAYWAAGEWERERRRRSRLFPEEVSSLSVKPELSIKPKSAGEWYMASGNGGGVVECTMSPPGDKTRGIAA
ncbi:Protein SMG5 [Liparis tanakae]|uniref:Protein SMG5 n=1 Tax=Liparis tanakae TaxID=230148 RepID=A0A4Z2J007_9TELE|nr:Protein SMG5 [Liparis tanakae]